MEIKVLGPGCPKCELTEKNVKEAVAEAGVDASVVKVKDVMEIARHGVFGTPAVVVDGQVKCVGKVPLKEEIKKWIEKK
ncbi:MAG: thioredoxin family protein [Desulfobacteraceae bacterium]|nr:MAG: thioredoxin family protein [Desulfobacteraceae bacterium]